MCGPGERIGGAFPAFSTFRRSLPISDMRASGAGLPLHAKFGGGPLYVMGKAPRAAPGPRGAPGGF